MRLPFTHEQFLGVFAAYNARWWPAASLLWLLTLGAVWVIYRWLGASRRLTFKPSSSIWRWIGIGLVVYALVYPLLGLLAGFRYPRLPTFGVPCPPAILTAGVLLTVPRRTAQWPAIVTILWTGIGGSAAFVQGIRADLALPLAGVLLLVYILEPASRARE